ncbi:ABC transporter permease [Paraburkholderia rhynchosiae]|uniref:Autoinducer 2 import system permease protein LsrC n=1 Tax=Paraburkholderia rhynchosiae TaxID=487049 RepID=A0A2N7WP33_9BURK|nr:ABC transporter permease [Paraburkholderia rhynchosiae]PMS31112.1 ATPase [Paraburkholderia rhynchosiae]CAB3701588.1 Ribose import permease protein RbsC [Paraburkholderia rhynchosiae]
MKNSVPSPAFGTAQAHGHPQPSAPQAPRGKRVRSELARLRELALLPALVLLVVIGALISPSFLTRANLISVLGASAALALVVLAESLIVLTGKFDLSLESTVGIAPAVGAMLVMPAASAGFGTQWPAAAGLLAILVVGAVIGAINGFLVVRLRLNAFIVTLAMLIVLRGMLVGATKGGTLFDMPSSFFSLATTIVLGLPLSVWLAGVAFAIAAFMLRYHRLGRALYAIGGNPEAARAAGIRVERITWGVFILGSMLASIGGLIVTGYVGAINANQGNGMIFTVFAAAVIGGISLDGGKGSMIGALSGVLLLGVVQNLLTLAQVPSFWIQAIYGAIILGSLMVARLASGEGQN